MERFRKKMVFALIALSLFCGAVANVYAEVKNEAVQQQAQLKGNVSDEAGPIIGATVSIVGKTVGTVTDTDGNFTLSGVTRGDVIRISYLGYVPQDITYSGQASLNVVLVENEKELDEVVVTALGIKRDSRALGYATSTIKGDDMIKAGV
ncbi:MAG: carboxypeptidase-like regulatory domain-containing protein, partial [Dysgonamonadaceae bacterium]|nr:carboxypeptidase-like regulatory domain-containing protein [Dysgonamonadaceae bacterium]